MNLLQFGNRLLDTGDVVFAERGDQERTVLLLRGGHRVEIDGEVGNQVWARLTGRLITSDAVARCKSDSVGN